MVLCLQDFLGAGKARDRGTHAVHSHSGTSIVLKKGLATAAQACGEGLCPEQLSHSFLGVFAQRVAARKFLNL